MIPEGWERTTLGRVAKITSGGTPDRTKAEYWGGNVPWVTTGEIGNGPIVSTGEHITELGLKSSSAKLFPPGTLLMAMYGQGKTRGKIAQLKIDATTNQACAAILTKSAIDAAFLFQNLTARYDEIRDLSNDGSQKNLSGGLLKALPILLPPPRERGRIADILSTWDRAIETVEALIANARERRQGLLDDLLDNPEWPRRSLSSIGVISSAGVDKKSNDEERPVKLLNFVDVLRRDFIDGRSLSHWVTAPERQIVKCDVLRGDVFFTPSSETRDDIAHSAVAVEDIQDAAYSYHVVRLRLEEPWPLAFRAYAFKSKAFLRQAQALCAGSGQRYVLSQKQFGSIAVHVPPLDAQRKIGNLLRAVDQERNALTTQRDALREEKAALMQQLLTGKRRVNVGQGEEA